MPHPIVLLPGDGIGPEVTDAARTVLDASGAELDWRVHRVGLASVEAGGDPLPDAVVAAIAECGVALKGPLSTPTDGSMPSVNMGRRRALDLQVQARFVRQLAPSPERSHRVDLAIIRQTTEDTYARIEFAAGSPDAAELADWLRARGKPVPAEAALAVKVCSAAASRLAFGFAAEYARRNDRARILAGHKSTMLPHTDGLFVATGREVLEGHPELQFSTMAVDALAAHLVERPEELDVVVLPSQYGDIMADLAGALVGGIGMVPGGNFAGPEGAVPGSAGVAVFEAAHGSAPKHAGRNRANPVAMILSGALALRHLGELRAATRVEEAVRAVLAGGRVRTYDLNPGRSAVGSVGTAEFAVSVVRAMQDDC